MSNLPNPIGTRDALLRERGWTLDRVFDTNAHEPHKDVCRVRTAEGKEYVLRVGERRPPNFFPNGYRGMQIVVPALSETSADPLFEVEEYLPGTLLSDLDPAPTAEHIVRPDLLAALIVGAWEVMDRFSSQSLDVRWNRAEKLDKHLAGARALLAAEEQSRVDAVLTTSAAFWQPTHPAKWKYAVDNIILMPNGRLGLIDLARVGLYPWGYDFGWIVWPRWFHLPIEVWREPSAHLMAIDEFVQKVIAHAPEQERNNTESIRQRMHLVLLERVIGAFYDIATPIAHARRIAKNTERRTAFLHFLHGILAWTLERCNR